MNDITITIAGWLPTALLVWLALGIVGTAVLILRNMMNGYGALDGLFTSDTLVSIGAGPVTGIALAVLVAKDGWLVIEPDDRSGSVKVKPRV